MLIDLITELEKNKNTDKSPIFIPPVVLFLIVKYSIIEAKIIQETSSIIQIYPPYKIVKIIPQIARPYKATINIY